MRKFSSFCGLALVLSGSACSDPNRWLGRLTSDAGSSDAGSSDAGSSDAGSSAQAPAPDTPFGPVTLIDELVGQGADQQDPTLTFDELEIYFTTTRTGQLDIWSSNRKSTLDPWNPPARVSELSSTYSDSNPEVSADGLSLYLSSNRGGTAVLWRSVRANRTVPWGAPTLSSNPTPGTADTAPSFDAGGLWLAVASVRGTPTFDLYLSSRAKPSDPWTEPSPLDVLESSADDWDPSLYFGATRIVFASRRNDDGDLFRASRTTTSEPFSQPVPVSELNTPYAEGDPWVSADGHRIYFASKNTGSVRIYFAER